MVAGYYGEHGSGPGAVDDGERNLSRSVDTRWNSEHTLLDAGCLRGGSSSEKEKRKAWHSYHLTPTRSQPSSGSARSGTRVFLFQQRANPREDRI
jgi:hypothetical protein